MPSDDEEEVSIHEIKQKRKLYPFFKDSYSQATTILVKLDPDHLLGRVGAFLQSAYVLSVKEHATKYKMYLSSCSDDQESDFLAMTISLGSVSEGELSLEFTRADMDPQEFY